MEVPKGVSSIPKCNLREFPAFQVCLSTVSLRVDNDDGVEEWKETSTQVCKRI